MCNCTHGQIEAPDGTPEFCIECVEGCDLELYRLVRQINGLHEAIHGYEVATRNGKKLANWEQHDLRELRHSHDFLVQAHDRIAAHRATLIGPYDHDTVEDGLFDTAQAALAGHFEPVAA